MRTTILVTGSNTPSLDIADSCKVLLVCKRLNLKKSLFLTDEKSSLQATHTLNYQDKFDSI